MRLVSTVCRTTTHGTWTWSSRCRISLPSAPRAHSSGAFRSDAPERTENEASRNKNAPARGQRVCPTNRRDTPTFLVRTTKRASTRCAATACLAKRTESATTSVLSVAGTAGDGSKGRKRLPQVPAAPARADSFITKARLDELPTKIANVEATLRYRRARRD